MQMQITWNLIHESFHNYEKYDNVKQLKKLQLHVGGDNVIADATYVSQIFHTLFIEWFNRNKHH